MKNTQRVSGVLTEFDNDKMSGRFECMLNVDGEDVQFDCIFVSTEKGTEFFSADDYGCYDNLMTGLELFLSLLENKNNIQLGKRY